MPCAFQLVFLRAIFFFLNKNNEDFWRLGVVVGGGGGLCGRVAVDSDGKIGEEQCFF